MNGSVRLGVDLGTTWTAAALRRGGRIEPVALGTDGPAMPSVVAVENGAIVAGEKAARQVLLDPASGLRESKRRLGDTAPMIMAGKPYGAEDLMAQLLRHVVATAGAGEGKVDEVVLTHPATWGDYKLDLVREIGRKAGVGDVTLLPEPVAAALHYVSLGRIAPGDVVAVYDFGGGTFDAAIVQCGERGAEILGKPEGLERLGGIDLDQIVIQHVDEALDGRLREIDGADPEGRRALVQLRAECTLAKEALSNDTEATIPVAVPGLNTQVRITRDEFETMARARVADTLGALDRAIAAAGVESAFLAGVLLVGGSSRIPLVADEVGRHTGRPTLLDADPKLVVALGAAGGGTVMTTSEKPVPAGPEAAAAAAAGSSESSPPPPARPAPPPAGPPASPAAQANAKAAALRAAAGQKPAAKQGPGGAAVAAGVVGAAAAAAGAGYLAMEYLDDDKDDKKDDAEPDEDALLDPEALAAPPDDSLDAFDDVSGGGGGGGGVRLRGGGGGRGRLVDDDGPSFAGGGRPAGAPSPGRAPAPEATLADISDARAELIERFAAWKPPANADAAEIAEFRAEVDSLLKGYQPRPGQDANDALGELRRQFDDQVEDFVQEQKLEALIEDRDKPDAPDVPERPPIPIVMDPASPAPQLMHHWVKASIRDGELVPAHWERANAVVRPVEDPTNASRWVEPYVNQYGQTVSGHWERVRVEGPPGEPVWVAPREDEYGNVHRGHYEHPATPGVPVDVPNRGLRYVESRYENGQWTDPYYESATNPGHPVDPLAPTNPPPPTPPAAPADDTSDVKWVDGRYENGKYVKGHYEDPDHPGVAVDPPPPAPEPDPRVTTPLPPPGEAHPTVVDPVWVGPRHDASGRLVEGHWEDRYNPGKPIDPPTNDPYPETVPYPDPIPPSQPQPPAPQPTPPPTQGPIVRDHRDGRDGGGGVTVERSARPRQRDEDRDVEGSGPLDLLRDVFDGGITPAGGEPRTSTVQQPVEDRQVPAGEDPPAPQAVARTVEQEDPLGTGAFTHASEAAPKLNLTAEIAPPAEPPAPAPAPEAAAPPAVPATPAATEPVPAAPVEPPPPVELPDPTAPADTDTPDPHQREDDETPTDLDNNIDTPL